MDINQDFKKFAMSQGTSSLRLDEFEKRNSMGFTGSYIEPTIIETNPSHHMISISVYSRLFMERILFVGTEIDSDVANILNSQLLYLEMENNEKPITMYINSPGGVVNAGMAIYDTMKYVKCPVHTTCMGMAASMGSVLLCAGEKGKRSALEHSEIMIHEPMGGIRPGTRSTDFKIEAEQMKKTHDMLMHVLSDNSKKSVDEMIELCSHDKWLTPTEAIEIGLLDKVIKSKK